MRALRQLVVLSALLAAPALHAQEARPLVVGAALAETGFLADLAADLRKALVLWQEQTNAAGGLLGRRIELRLLDDRSEAAAAGRLYEELIEAHGAELLVGPLGSAATLGAAAAAERRRRVLVNATGAARVVHRSGLRYVFQVAAPLGAWGEGPLELARASGIERVVLLARDEPAARESAGRALELAAALGFAGVTTETYSSGTTDFSPHVARARAAGAEGWIAFGAARDAAEMVKTFKRMGYAPRLFVAEGAAEPEFIARVGQDAEYAAGISPWERRAATAGNAQFAAAFAARWSADPGVVAAQGYAAARVLEAAVRRAGGFGQDALREALAAQRVPTPLGEYRVDRDGVQLGHRPLVVQVVRGRREIVWPEALATARWTPYPAWQARKSLH